MKFIGTTKKSTSMHQTQLMLLSILCFCTPSSRSQQLYAEVQDCMNKTAPYLYTCNGEKPTCQSFAIIVAKPRYDSAPSISVLMSSDLPEVARLNSVSTTGVFPINKEVIVPINCSCLGEYYSAITFISSREGDTYYTVAYDVYQGLSTCRALMSENPYDENLIPMNAKLRIPLRCACPTKEQSTAGIKYLLTYSSSQGDRVLAIARRFNADIENTKFVNGFSLPDPATYEHATVLIPLMREPSSSQTVIRGGPSSQPSSDRRHTAGKLSKVGVSVGTVTAAVSALVLAAGLLILYRRRNPIRKAEWYLPKDIQMGIKVFEFEEVDSATNSFSPECRIGRSVYCGVMNGRSIAIKEVTGDVSAEVNILHKLNHFNLIQLRGLCAGARRWYLLYEHMENGSLEERLHDMGSSRLWSLTQRVQIALDIAEGLNYLHNFSEPPYVHKDIKSSNVLLDGNFRAKIANFGLARSVERGKSEASITKNVEGTVGYMAPEYLAYGSITTKVDVYAFGVVLSELVTGKNAIIKHEDNLDKDLLLSAVMVSIVQGGNAEVELSSFIDSSVAGRYPIEFALALAKLSVACLRRGPESRPSMDQVVSVLSRIHMDLQSWEASSAGVEVTVA